MNVLIWHVHGAWTTNFVQGDHTYLVPVVPDRGPTGRGRAASYDWPDRVVERTPAELADSDVDVVVVQGPDELSLAQNWLGGRRPGTDVPLVWLEHNAPQGRINEMRHPARDRDDLTLVHVTHTNALFWDAGSTRARVIEHGIVDPGRRWTGDEVASGVVVNEPVRRARVVGADLLPHLAEAGPIDVYGMGTPALAAALGRPDWLRVHDDVRQRDLHACLASRRCYVHPFRWTSLGLSLIEAMHLGMPVVALATTEVPDAVPRRCGVVSNDVRVLVDGIRHLHADAGFAAECGEASRQHAVERFGLERFLAEWDDLLTSLAC